VQYPIALQFRGRFPEYDLFLPHTCFLRGRDCCRRPRHLHSSLRVRFWTVRARRSFISPSCWPRKKGLGIAITDLTFPQRTDPMKEDFEVSQIVRHPHSVFLLHTWSVCCRNSMWFVAIAVLRKKVKIVGKMHIPPKLHHLQPELRRRRQVEERRNSSGGRFLGDGL